MRWLDFNGSPGDNTVVIAIDAILLKLISRHESE